MITVFYIRMFFAGVAQLVEQLIRNQQVSGSSPLTSSTQTRMNTGFVRVFIYAKIQTWLPFDYFSKK